MKLDRITVVGLTLVLILSFSLQVGSTAIDTGNYYLDNPLPVASYYVGVFSNGTYFAINGSNWDCFARGSDADVIINNCLGNMTSTTRKKERLILAGDFTIDMPIQVSSYDEVDMRQARIYLDDDADCTMIMINTTNNNRGGAYVHGGNLFGNKENNAAGHGILMYGGANNVLEDIDISNVSDHGVFLDGDWGTWSGFHNIRNVKVWYAGDCGFKVDAQVDNYFYRCIAQQCVNDGFYLYGTNMLVECHPVNNGRDNFYIPTVASSNQFIDCYSNIAGRSCWRINSNGQRIVNPHADYANQDDSNYAAIYINADFCQIIGGYVRGSGAGAYPDNAYYGIHLTSSADYCTITVTNCSGADQIQIFNEGSNNRIAAWNGSTWTNNW